MGKKHGKRYREALTMIPAERVDVPKAVEILQQLPPTKFDPTVEVSMNLGIDPKQADQGIRGALSLPHGIGASRRVVAFCEGDDVQKALDAGAIEAGTDELIKKIQDGWTDFDVAIATPATMKSVSRLGRVLGPQGLMPSPKAGTVVDDVPTAVQEYSAGKVEFRNDETGNLHAVVGKASFEPDKLAENIQAFIDHIRRMRPITIKGMFFRRVSVSLSMSPSIDLAV